MFALVEPLKLPMRGGLALEIRPGHFPPVPAELLLCSRLPAKEELTILGTERDSYRREG
jgi:hypothetical protein